MPAGVGGNQPNDALTAARLLTVTIDSHLVIASLQRVGVSIVGAQQFSQGQPVANAADRVVIAKTLSELLKLSRS